MAENEHGDMIKRFLLSLLFSLFYFLFYGFFCVAIYVLIIFFKQNILISLFF